MKATPRSEYVGVEVDPAVLEEMRLLNPAFKALKNAPLVNMVLREKLRDLKFVEANKR